jgi:hypothetical protein
MRDKQTFIAHLTEVSQSPSLREGLGVGSSPSPKGEARRGLLVAVLRKYPSRSHHLVHAGALGVIFCCAL